MVPLSKPRYAGGIHDDAEWDNFVNLLERSFRDQIFGIMDDILLTHEYVGYVHFRDRVLAPVIGRALGEMVARKLINRLIDKGELELYKIEPQGTAGYTVNAIRKLK